MLISCGPKGPASPRDSDLDLCSWTRDDRGGDVTIILDGCSDKAANLTKEAMKLMNEIESEVAGTVVEVLATNGDPVQFGQVLFRIEPS